MTPHRCALIVQKDIAEESGDGARVLAAAYRLELYERPPEEWEHYRPLSLRRFDAWLAELSPRARDFFEFLRPPEESFHIPFPATTEEWREHGFTYAGNPGPTIIRHLPVIPSKIE